MAEKKPDYELIVLRVVLGVLAVCIVFLSASPTGSFQQDTQVLKPWAQQVIDRVPPQCWGRGALALYLAYAWLIAGPWWTRGIHADPAREEKWNSDNNPPLELMWLFAPFWIPVRWVWKVAKHMIFRPLTWLVFGSSK